MNSYRGGKSKDITEQTAISYLLKQNKHILAESAQCTLLKFAPIKNRQDYFQAVLQVDIISYKNTLKCGHCLIGLDSRNIYDVVDIIRYCKCNGFNHSSITWKKSFSCPRCLVGSS